jgi:hypothetical protein
MALPTPLFGVTEVQFVNAWQACFIFRVEINLEDFMRMENFSV